jgi:hypothetical protein
MKTEYQRFINKVNFTSNCWEWTGTKYRGGYGHFRRQINGEWVMAKAHRYSYEVHKGPIPDGLLILHSCDNPSCVNPAHLRAGTAKENVQDMIKKGRKKYGTSPGNKQHSKELAEYIREFRRDNPERTQVEIAWCFQTSPAQVSRILNQKIWK